MVGMIIRQKSGRAGAPCLASLTVLFFISIRVGGVPLAKVDLDARWTPEAATAAGSPTLSRIMTPSMVETGAIALTQNDTEPPVVPSSMETVGTSVLPQDDKEAPFVPMLASELPPYFNVTITTPERLFGAQEDRPHQWRTMLLHINYALSFVIFAAILCLLMSLASFLGNTMASDVGLGATFLWLCWCSTCLFVILMGSEIYAASTALVGLNDGAGRLLDAVNKPSIALQGLSQAAKASGVAGQLKESEPDVISTDRDDTYAGGAGYHAPRAPIFCASAFAEGDLTYNEYPIGSLLNQYNRRRALGILISPRNSNTTEEMEGENRSESADGASMERLRSTLLSDPFPPRDGNFVSTEDARAIGAVSNACEAEDGDIQRCCDESLASSYADLERRCPGLALQRRGSANHCNCAVAISDLGFTVEDGMIGLCASHMRRVAVQAVEHIFGIDIGVDMTADADTGILLSSGGGEYGCTGVLDAAMAEVKGAFVLRSFADDAAHKDRERFDRRSMYIAWSPGIIHGSVRVEWHLKGCLAGLYTFQLRTANEGSPRRLKVYVDGLGSTELRIGAVEGQTWNDWTVGTVFQHELSAGDHSIVFYSVDNSFPHLHQIAVCLRGDRTTGCAHFN